MVEMSKATVGKTKAGPLPKLYFVLDGNRFKY